MSYIENVKGDVYEIFPSTRKFKKYDVLKNGRHFLSFGDKRYQHYKDKIGYYKHLDHKDRKRLDLYYIRHKDTNNINSAKFWSHLILW